MASPAMTIVFTDSPNCTMMRTALKSETGIATALISALLMSARNKSKTRTTMPQPIQSAEDKFVRAVSIKVAGRKIVVSISISPRPGRRASSASSTPRVTSSVLPQGYFSTINNKPGRPLMIASPMAGGAPIRTLPTSPTLTVVPFRDVTTARLRSSGECTQPSCRMASR